MMPYDSFVFRKFAMSTPVVATRKAQTGKTRRLGLIFPLALLAGCQTPAPPGPEDTAVLASPVRRQATPLPEAPRFVVDPDASEIRLLVYRAGPLARFGHNHVISGHARGEIRAGANATASGFRLDIPVASLVVDDPAARAQEDTEFSAQVSAEARRGTREHMLGKDVLDADAYPSIVIESIALSGPRWNPTVRARVTLRGAARELRFPAAVVQCDGLLTVVADFRLRQSEFGIAPYSTLGGGLSVRDEIGVRVHLLARRTG
jgi:polyisoprenoid-binding protein YceI